MTFQLLALESEFWLEVAIPALINSRRKASFLEGKPLWEALSTKITLRPRAITETFQLILKEDFTTLPFDRHVWRQIAEETLWLGAEKIHTLEIDEELWFTICPAWIHTVFYGSRPISLHGDFRPNEYGWHPQDQVILLHNQLRDLNESDWRVPATLRSELAEEERQADLEDLRDWFKVVKAIFAEAIEKGHVLICHFSNLDNPITPL